MAYGAYRDAVAGPERSADVASLRHVLARRRPPSSARAGIPARRRPDLLRPRLSRRCLAARVPATGLASLKDMRLRVSGMPDNLQQVTELDLSPVIARPDSAGAADAQIRIQPAQPADAYLRPLR